MGRGSARRAVAAAGRQGEGGAAGRPAVSLEDIRAVAPPGAAPPHPGQLPGGSRRCRRRAGRHSAARHHPGDGNDVAVARRHVVRASVASRPGADDEGDGRRPSAGTASQPIPRLQRGVQPVSALSARRRSEVRRLESVCANRSDLHAPVPRDDQSVGAVCGRRQPVDGLSIREPGAGSREPSSKFELARSVAAILGTLVLDQGDAAGVLAVDERAHFVPPRSGHHHLRVFLAGARVAAARAAPRRSPRRCAALPTILKRRGLVIVVSDLYEDEAAIGQMRRLARMGHDVIVIHTLAREELTLDVGGAAEFVDLESGRRLMVQPSAARESYVAASRTGCRRSSSSFAATASITCG